MSEAPAARRTVAGSPATWEDVVATLAAMQDQIDDLTAVVEVHQKRLDELSGRSSAHANGRPSR